MERDIMDEEVSGYVSAIRFNDGTKLEINSDDIVVFVGPNNVGKSRALRDIYELSRQEYPSVVVSDIKLQKTPGKLTLLLQRVAEGRKNGPYTEYSLLNHTYIIYRDNNDDVEFLNNEKYGDFCDLFVANLDTTARLTICDPPNNINRDEPKLHPIHYAAFDIRYRRWLSECYRKAFDTYIYPNTHFGATIPLCIGEAVKLEDDYDDEQLRTEAYAAILEKYDQVQNQGDGIKGFTGILLYLMLDYYHTYIIDEPESFLHPPQARIMGKLIGQTLTTKQQAFISTHSEEILKGLLEVCPNRIKIVRITRDHNINRFSILKNDMINEVWNDPLLKYSNIMSSIFHKSVVLCESDSDCKMYSIIDSYLKQSEGKYSQTLFIHCGGKQRMAKIAKALRAINIEVHLIPDIDVLNDEHIFRSIVESYGVDWETIKTDYKILRSNLQSNDDGINRERARASINAILSKTNERNISGNDLSAIYEVLSKPSKWSLLKKMGVSAIPAGDARNAYNRINEILKTNKVHIVPVGELEGFIREIGKHGPEWVNKVLEEYPDISCDVYASIRQFVADMKL